MTYFKQVYQNFKKNMPLVVMIGVFTQIIVGFSRIPEDRLPKFFQYDYLLIYLFILLGTAILIVAMCIFAPLHALGRINKFLQYTIRTSELLSGTKTLLPLLTFTLIGIGLVMTYSCSAPYALSNMGDSYFFVKREALFVLIAVLMFAVWAIVPYKPLKKLGLPCIAMSIITLLLGYIGFSVGVEGTTSRWIKVGNFYLDYLGFTKMAFIVYLAGFLSSRKPNYFSIIPIGIVSLLVLFIQESYDWGTISLFILSGIIMLIVNANDRMASILFVATLLVLTLIYLPFLFKRTELVGGGLFGVGLGYGTQKLELELAAFTNSIFLTIAEEMGLIGTTIIIFLFCAYACLGVVIGLRTLDSFGRLLVFGSTAIIVFQAFLNIGSVIGLMPLGEISLPFISYGGSLLITYAVLTAIIFSVDLYG